MKLLLVIICFQAILSESAESTESTEVTGYIGENVILISGADPNRTLSTINWSIYTNNTYIATLSKGTIQLEWFYRYKGRLSLNNSSGDLIIRNLSEKDAMEYNVGLTDTERNNSALKITLKVKQRLQKPNIHIISLPSAIGSCWWQMYCSATDNVNNLTWYTESTSVTFISNPSDRFIDIVVFMNNTENIAEFNCTAIKNSENISEIASKVVTLKCVDVVKSTKIMYYFILFVLGICLGIVIAGFIIYRSEIRNVCKHTNV